MSADVVARVAASWHELGIPGLATKASPSVASNVGVNGVDAASVVNRVVEVARELLGRGRP
jgi:hypothetical protein